MMDNVSVILGGTAFVEIINFLFFFLKPKNQIALSEEHCLATSFFQGLYHANGVFWIVRRSSNFFSEFVLIRCLALDVAFLCSFNE
jgi:hypothetical protein